MFEVAEFLQKFLLFFLLFAIVIDGIMCREEIAHELRKIKILLSGRGNPFTQPDSEKFDPSWMDAESFIEVEK